MAATTDSLAEGEASSIATADPFVSTADALSATPASFITAAIVELTSMAFATAWLARRVALLVALAFAPSATAAGATAVPLTAVEFDIAAGGKTATAEPFVAGTAGSTTTLATGAAGAITAGMAADP